MLNKRHYIRQFHTRVICDKQDFVDIHRKLWQGRNKEGL